VAVDGSDVFVRFDGEAASRATRPEDLAVIGREGPGAPHHADLPFSPRVLVMTDNQRRDKMSAFKSFISRVRDEARSRRPWLRVSVSPRVARFLIAAGARPEGGRSGPAADKEDCLVTVMRAGDPLVTFGVAADERGAAKLWPLIARPGVAQPSAVPWLAVGLEVGVAVHPGDLGWLADFERCWAWCWLNNVGRASR
jgi:hypothetical protein